MKRILYVVYDLNTGGIQSFITNALEKIDADLFQVDIVVASDEKYIYKIEEKLKELGCTIWRTNTINNKKNKYYHFFKLLKIMRQAGPYDAIHSHMGHMNKINLLAATMARVPRKISHSHTASTHRKSKPKLEKVKHFFSTGMIRMLATRMIGCSKEANEWLHGKNKNNNKKKDVLYNGIDLDKFKEGPSVITKSQLNLPEDKVLLLHVGRITYLKNPLFIIEIVNELKKIRKDIHLIYVGTGEMQKEVIQKINQYGLQNDITMLGTRLDVAEILKISDYFLFPSIREGLGMSLIEAQIGNKLCFISDMIPEESDLGLCIRIPLSKSASEWAKIISTYVDKKNEISNKLNLNYTQKFDVNHTVNVLQELYSE